MRGKWTTLPYDKKRSELLFDATSTSNFLEAILSNFTITFLGRLARQKQGLIGGTFSSCGVNIWKSYLESHRRFSLVKLSFDMQLPRTLRQQYLSTTLFESSFLSFQDDFIIPNHGRVSAEMFNAAYPSYLRTTCEADLYTTRNGQPVTITAVVSLHNPGTSVPPSEKHTDIKEAILTSTGEPTPIEDVIPVKCSFLTANFHAKPCGNSTIFLRDRKRKLESVLQRFPSSNTCLLNSLRYSIFYSQLLTYLHSSNRLSDFIADAKHLFLYLHMKRGYSASYLVRWIMVLANQAPIPTGLLKPVPTQAIIATSTTPPPPLPATASAITRPSTHHHHHH
ncbi:hypothetical protein CYMTET_45085 [Cymbomonas tetramitiformis]|uniref:Uncharacterized protein n=1 Tax=Cymbomonas tetramitiformis TaxID=36881 RepID=A0AAE0C0M8_9CHLO|nr:hypothetical protein CYMTET_45085 [Cymbomonas tetramitiformis]